jgi:hypothetical protein
MNNAIKFWFTTSEALEHAAKAYEAAYGSRCLFGLALNESTIFEGYHADTVADAINGGPIGGHYENL